MVNKKVGIIVDNPKRDLTGCALLAQELLKLNINSILIPMYETWREISNLKLDGIVLNYARVTNAKLINWCHENNISIYIHDTEGGILGESGPNSPENIAQQFDQLNLSSKINKYFFWGDNLRNAYLKHSKLHESKAITTGSIRHDLFSKLRKSNNFTKSYHLICTNFALSNPAFNTKEKEIVTLVKHGWSEDSAIEISNTISELQKNFVKEIKKLATMCPGEKFKIRCHPFEKESFYTEIFENHQNVVVCSKGEIFHALLEAKTLIHAFCSTAVDASFFEIPSINLDYLLCERTRNLAPATLKVSLNASSISELKRGISLAGDSASNQKNLEEYLKHFYYDLTGGACQRVANEIHDDLLKKTSDRWPHKHTNAYNQLPTKQKILYIASMVIGSKNMSSILRFLMPKKKIKYFTCDDIYSSFDKLSLNKNFLLSFASCKKVFFTQSLNSIFVTNKN